MQEYETKVLEKYSIVPDSIRKTRGAMLCHVQGDSYLLKEVGVSLSRITTLQELYNYLLENGCEKVDNIIPNQDGEYVTVLENGRKYILKRWFEGRECDYRKPAELLEASGRLAKLHGYLHIPEETFSEKVISVTENLKEEYRRHDRELRKVHRFIREKTSKNDFEYAFLDCFDEIYRWAQTAEDLLECSDYEKLLKDSERSQCFVHGEYNYHNVIVKQDSLKNSDRILAVTNFEHFHKNIQIEDLYYFLRKVMEKHSWKERLGDNMLNAYSAIHPLSDAEEEYLILRLVYPEKFWKIANSYYHSNKAWLSSKNMEKLEMVIRQTKEKERFLSNIFAFHL